MSNKSVPLYVSYDKKDLLRIKFDNPELIKAQVESVSRQLPWLYVCLSGNVIALTATHWSAAPIWLVTIFPAIFVAIAAMRTLQWFNTSRTEQTPETRRYHLKRLLVLTSLLCVTLTGWSFALFEFGNAYQQAHVAFFISLTLVACIYATIQFPAASLLALAIVGTMFVGRLIMTGNPVLIAMAVNFVLVGVIFFRIIENYYGTFVGLINSRRRMVGQNREMKRMYQEVEFHRDRLASEVKKRTRELEEQALKLEAALEGERELNQLQNEFVAMVSHEFRTPLTIIDATARRLSKQADIIEPEMMKTRLGGIREATKRLSNLVEQTLESARHAEGKMSLSLEPYNPKELIFDVIARHREIAIGHTIIADLDTLPSVMVGDKRLMDTVFSNLLSNAIKYSEKNPRVEIYASTAKGAVSIQVRDYGIGIPKSELSKIANRFFRASTANGIKGTGIGLNLARSIVEDHTGKFEVDSEEGEWTEVTITLPVDIPLSDESESAFDPTWTEKKAG